MGGDDDSDFNPEAFVGALIEAFKTYAVEDAANYGKLRAVKQSLASIMEDRMPDEVLAGIYFRDIVIVRGLDPVDGSFESVLENLPNA